MINVATYTIHTAVAEITIIWELWKFRLKSRKFVVFIWTWWRCWVCKHCSCLSHKLME